MSSTYAFVNPRAAAVASLAAAVAARRQRGKNLPLKKSAF
jgi:hypothetical protein